LVLGGHNI